MCMVKSLLLEYSATRSLQMSERADACIVEAVVNRLSQKPQRFRTSVTSQNGDVSGGPGMRPGMVSATGGPDRCFCLSFLASRLLFSSSLCCMYAVASVKVKGRPPLFSGRPAKLPFAASNTSWCAARALSESVHYALSGFCGHQNAALGINMQTANRTAALLQLAVEGVVRATTQASLAKWIQVSLPRPWTCHFCLRLL